MSLPLPTTIVKFVLAALVGSLGMLGIADLAQSGPTTAARPGPAGLYTADTPAGPVAFALAASSGVRALPQPPASEGAQLISFTTNPVPPNAPAGLTPAWWSSAGHSRVPPVTQFDGGPLQAENCTMASGAMLARLGFGIVTTGSQLRALQAKQSGGTSLIDLENALQNGWGVQFAAAAITPLQLRELVYAGAGAVVQGTYADIPPDLRLQKDFLGGHAVYLDGFRPPSGANPAAYFVVDPIGLPSEGYRGAWWPADAIEKFATDFGAGSVDAAWSFAGGATPPAHFPVLPPGAFPSSSPAPGASPLPVSSPGSLASGGASPTGPATPLPTLGPPPTLVPLPTAQASPPSGSSGDQGPHVPPLVATFAHLNATVGASSIVATLGVCLENPAPASCPAGIPALYPLGRSPVLPAVSPPPVDLLYASIPQPGVMQVIFTAPGSSSSFLFWPSGETAQLQPAASLDQATLGGTPVWIATFPVAAGGSYQFAAGAAGAGFSGLSGVGAVTIGP